MKFISRGKHLKIDKAVVRIVAIYLLFGLCWIFFSDTILSAIVSDKAQFAHYSIYKGWVYMGLTSLLLYTLVTKTLRQQSAIEHSLQVSEERWKFALEGSGEGVWDWDMQTDHVFRSARWHDIYQYQESDLLPTAEYGRTLIHPDDLARTRVELNDYLSGKTFPYTSEFRLRCKDGSWKWTLSRGMLVSTTPDGRPLRMIGTHTDISARKDSEEEIFRLAHYDTITGLPNRVLFLDRFEEDIKKARRTEQPITLMYLDLDRFKEINDSLGHDVGDLLLQEAAQRLQASVRATDTVARLGGDEFTIILNNLDEAASVERVAQQILHTIAQPFQLNDEIIYITTSIGMTVFPTDGEAVDVLLKNADQAMYAAKNEGRNGYYYFTSSMQAASLARMRTTNDMRTAISEQQFRVYYQPIVELATGTIRKAEALIRWQHPSRGLVNPAEFIPIAEDTGLIVEIGDYVFTEVTRQMVQWRQYRHDFQISVNKSPVEFKNDKRPHLHWQQHLMHMGLPGDCIVVEITEGLLVDGQGSVVQELHGFREAGIHTAIDDFGTGYSSLAYLKKFDIDYVKIDQSFTRNIQPGSDDMALCEAIIVMAHKLGIKVIAEGVETPAQRDLLQEAGCDFAQGYLFSRPIPAEAFEKLLQPYRLPAPAALA